MENNLHLLIAALRSDEFKQAKKSLRDGDGYCCLGVACEVYRRHTGKGEWVNPESGVKWKFELPGNLSQVAFMPTDVYHWFGLPDQNPILHFENDEAYPATELNDSMGWDFNQIADAFERTFPRE